MALIESGHKFYMTKTNQNTPNFNTLGISPELLEVLDYLKFTTPTPIQHQCIPAALEGKDVVGIAQTGTGKTLAFGVPMIQLLRQNKGQGLILVPTRELAMQVNEVLHKIGERFDLRTVVLIGGTPANAQIKTLRLNPHIIVSTPGRLIDLLKQKKLSLFKVKMLILDEADRMFDIGFAPQIKQILAMAPRERQTMMFSATMPKAIADMAAQFMKMPWRIEVAPAGTTVAQIEQEIFMVPREMRIQLLDKLLTGSTGSVLIFSRTKFGAKKIAMLVRAMGQTAVEIHSNRSLLQRQTALAGFKSGQYRVLVATDIAARGIDVTGISLVINFDLPSTPDDYVHRIGRTGRAGSIGRAVSFASSDERMAIRQIEKLIKKTIPVVALPVLPPRRVVTNTDRRIHSSGSRPFQNSRSSQDHKPFRGPKRNFRRR